MPDDTQSRDPGPPDLVNRLRQQLILAQVRIMELEDERDTLAPKLAETAALLGEAQSVADRQSEAAAHLERMRADLQGQYEHMRHVQHVTNEALDECRRQLASRDSDLAAAQDSVNRLSTRLADLEHQHVATQSLLAQSQLQAADLQARLAAAMAESSARGDRIQQLDSELRTMKATRSWRWTAWLRSLERALRGKSR